MKLQEELGNLQETIQKRTQRISDKEQQVLYIEEWIQGKYEKNSYQRSMCRDRKLYIESKTRETEELSVQAGERVKRIDTAISQSETRFSSLQDKLDSAEYSLQRT